MYADPDHLHGLGEFLVGTVVVPTAIAVYCLWPVWVHYYSRSRQPSKGDPGKKKNPAPAAFATDRIRRNLVVSAVLVLLPAILLTHLDEPQRPTFIPGKDPLLQKLLDACPILRQGPQPSFWFRNRHVQYSSFRGCCRTSSTHCMEFPFSASN